MDTLRLSDADREAAVERLGEQYAVGRLTKDEFDERSDAVWSARTQGDLAPVFADLPWRSPPAPQAGSGPRPGWGPRWGPRWAPPLLPLVFLLVVLTIVFKVPFVLLLVGLWFAFGWRHQARRHMRHRRAQLR